MKILAAGEILWDVFDTAEHLGGATLNFAAHSRRLGHEVDFVSAVGADERGRRALERLRELDLSARYVRVAGQAASGCPVWPRLARVMTASVISPAAPAIHSRGDGGGNRSAASSDSPS